MSLTALGKFEDLSSNARTAALEGVSSELTSASAVNYAAGIVTGTFSTDLNAASICSTTVLAPLFQSGTFPTGYLIDSTSNTGDCATTTAGNTVTCTVVQDTNSDGTAQSTEPDKDISVVCTE